MFKQTKKRVNENSVKKDFFKVVKHEEKLDLTFEVQYKNNEFVILDKFKSIKLPDPDQCIQILTTLNNSSIDLFKNLQIDELIILCSRLDLKSIEKLSHIKNKYLILYEVVKEKKPDIFAAAEKSFTKVITCKNHAKMLLFKIGENHYVCETSANPSINARNEFYNLYNNKNAYNKIVECLKIKETSQI